MDPVVARHASHSSHLADGSIRPPANGARNRPVCLIRVAYGVAIGGHNTSSLDSYSAPDFRTYPSMFSYAHGV